LPADSDTSFETWVSRTNYPEWRRQDLRIKWAKIEKIENLDKRYHAVKSFVKDEFYPDFKHARGINSRTDEFKCAVGPIFKLIEEAVFKDRHFIKRVPVALRPQVIASRLQRLGGKVVTTDYTSFESLFTAEFMDACEFELYDYMTSELPDGPTFMNLVRDVLAGKNRCHWRDFIVEVLATRMSGEMCTSLGNGFANLMLMLFLNEEELKQQVDGFVEGDDGIFVVTGEPPSPADYARLGMVVKLEVHESINTASFCGIVFDVNDLCNLTDPLEVIAKFGYANNRYLRVNRKKTLMLLRCKALSLAHQYPGCPIIQSLAYFGLRATKRVQYYLEGWVKKGGPAGTSMWERDQLLEAIKEQDKLVPRSIGEGSRLLVEKLWDIPTNLQLAVESKLDAKNDLEPLYLPDLVARIPSAWVKYWDGYSTVDDVYSDKVVEPQLPVGKLPGFKPEWTLG